jgi:hypothetical protein
MNRALLPWVKLQWGRRGTTSTGHEAKTGKVCVGEWIQREGQSVEERRHEWWLMLGNISSGNRPLHANYGNFNLSHTILIQGRAHGRWKGWFANFKGGGRRDLQRWFCKSPLPPPMISLLDQHCVTQNEVSIVCMERLVSTWYVALMLSTSRRANEDGKERWSRQSSTQLGRGGGAVGPRGHKEELEGQLS